MKDKRFCLESLQTSLATLVLCNSMSSDLVFREVNNDIWDDFTDHTVHGEVEEWETSDKV